MAAVWALNVETPSAAPRTSPALAPKPKGKAETKASHAREQSPEALAELAHDSVVVISHFGREGKEDGVGAGFVVGSEGLIATSLHVIGEARPISVRLANGQRHDVVAVHAWDRKLDLAIIRINADKLPALPLGDSDTLRQGTPVMAMGNPLGLEHSVVQGILSAKRDFDGLEMLQVAVPIEPGNSGGPLLDMRGNVHGILNMKSAMTANLGFATPINALKPLLQKPNSIPIDRWMMIGALNPKDWRAPMGARWTQRAGRIRVEGLGQGFGGRSLCLWRREVPARPYEVAVTVKLDDESGAAGLAFDSDDGERHYGFYPTAGQLRLTRFEGADVFSWSIIETVPSAHYQPGGWNRIKVRVDPDRVRCYVNGQLVIESAELKLPHGKVGLAKFRDTRAEFKGFEVGARLEEEDEMAALPPELAQSLRQRLADSSGRPAEPELVKALQAHPAASRLLLTERVRQLERQAGELRRLAARVNQQAVQAELVNLLQKPEAEIDLFHAALLVSKLDDADLDIEAYRHQMDTMSRELASGLADRATASAKLAALRNYLFVENGFRGSRTDYYNRANSYINQVLDDREGLPIALSVLFLELARRIGLEDVVGVPLPGHFVVKHIPKQDQEQLIDVFDGGKILTRPEAEALVSQHAGVALRESHLKPAAKRDIIVRMLRNLLGIAQRTGSAAESLPYLDLILALDPEATTERLERAQVRLQTGDRPGAKEDFKWLLDHAPSGADLERLTEFYQSL